MLTLEEEEQAEGLRRELVVVLHLTPARMATLPDVDGWREAFRPLVDVRSRFEGVSVEHAALRIAAPPFLNRDRLRGLLTACLERLLGDAVPYSVRILTELGETLQAAFELEEAWLEQGATPGHSVLCFTDEEAVGGMTMLLSELKQGLEARRTMEVAEAFPLNHYDILTLWVGPEATMVDGAASFIRNAYEALTEGPVSVTGRKLAAAEDLLRFLGS